MLEFLLEARPPGTPTRVLVGSGAIARGLPGKTAQRALLVTEPGVFGAHGPDLSRFCAAVSRTQAAPLVLPEGEEAKAIERLPGYLCRLADAGLDRSSLMVLAGGGSALDVGAFLAAIHLRGIDAVVVPTTLLAQVDAGLGGKCGMNVGGAKNQAGLVRQPHAIVVDPLFLRTEPVDARASGFGEVAKTALIAGGELLERLLAGPVAAAWSLDGLEPVIGLCLRTKAGYVERDPEDLGERHALNLGHTAGHILESASFGTGRPLAHGDAVALGLLAEAIAFSTPEVAGLVSGLIRRLGLSAKVPFPWEGAVSEGWFEKDKKRQGGTIRMPVLLGPGKVQVRSLPSGEAREAITRGIAAIS